MLTSGIIKTISEAVPDSFASLSKVATELRIKPNKNTPLDDFSRHIQAASQLRIIRTKLPEDRFYKLLGRELNDPELKCHALAMQALLLSEGLKSSIDTRSNGNDAYAVTVRPAGWRNWFKAPLPTVYVSLNPSDDKIEMKAVGLPEHAEIGEHLVAAIIKQKEIYAQNLGCA
jgi:hypothetical protein